MTRGALLLGAVPTLVFGLACACGSGATCEEGERDDWGTCVPIDCGEYPFGGYAGGDFVFVSASTYSEDEDQDGSEEDPYNTLAEGITAALVRDRSLVVVASGTYRESLLFDDRHDGLRIEGVCGPQVRIEGGELPTVMLDASPETAVTVSSVQLANGLAAGVVVVGGRLALTNVGVDGAKGVGVAAFGSESFLEVDDLRVTETAAQEGQDDGYGFAVADGATAVVDRLSVAASGLAGVLIDGADSSAVIARSSVVGSPIGRVGLSPAGIIVSNGARATVADTDVFDAWGVGLEVSGNSTVEAERLTVSWIYPTAVGGAQFGNGVVVLEGSTFEAVDLQIQQASLYGLAASGEGTTVDLDGGAIENSTPTPEEPTAGIGLITSDGAVLTASNLRLADNHVYGAVVSDPGSTLVLTDTDVFDTAQTDVASIGGGILAQAGGDLDAVRVTVAGSGTIGILVDAATATLTDVGVEDTRRGSVQSTAVGIAVQADASIDGTTVVVSGTDGPGILVSGAELTCTGCTSSGNTFAGVLAIDGARLVLAGAEVVDTVPDATEGGGVGVFVDSRDPPVTLNLTGAEVRGNTHAAVYVAGAGDVRIEDTTLVGGAATRDVWPRGTALFASGTTADGLVIAGNRISDSAGAGLFFDGGTATLVDNRYTGNTIDVVQQLCGPATETPLGLEDEPVDVVELCPAYDRPVDSFTFVTVYAPLVLGG